MQVLPSFPSYRNPSVTRHDAQIPGLTAGAGCERRVAVQPTFSPARQGGVGPTDGCLVWGRCGVLARHEQATILSKWNCFFVEIGHEVMGVALLSVLGQIGQRIVNKGPRPRTLCELARIGDSVIHSDNSFSIGRTPLVRLTRVTAGARATVLAKIEGRNPAYSVKDRIGASMVWDAERRGTLKPGKEIVEPTSGNTGIALAFVGAARGYKVTLLMPETMSMERRKVLKALGASIILTDGALGMRASIERAEEMVAAEPDRYVLLQQFQNPANPEIHFKTTGPEIWQDTQGRVDALVAGIGTGGTITGISRYFKLEKKQPLLSIGVEPASSPVITQTLAGEPVCPGPTGIQGLGAGFIPGTLDLKMLDRIERVTDEEAIEMARRLAREEGILSGISCGAAVAVALRVAREPAMRGKNIVTILPDSGERYLSSALFDSVLD
jgi:cysteine synthase